MVSTSTIQPSLWTHASCSGHPPGQELVSGALSSKSARESPGIIPEVAEVLGSQRAEDKARETDDEEEFVPFFEGDEVLPDNETRLGGSWSASLQARVQYA